MTCAIEDAGFEVRDMIEWVYGSGFPKSLNIGKAVDKMEGVEHPKNTLVSDNGSMSGGNYTRNKMDVQSELAKQWEGWGTALKPAHEPICMARKPLAEKTVAENCLKWGTGGINIDESRVEGTYENEGRNIRQEDYKSEAEFLTALSKEGRKTRSDSNPQGRFPANLIHDNSEEVRECFPDSGKGNGKGAYNYAGREYDNKDTSIFNGDKPQAPSNFNDSGNASRFFKSIPKENEIITCNSNQKQYSMSALSTYTTTCKNTFVNSAERLLKIIQAIKENTVLLNADDSQEEKLDRLVKNAEKNADL